VAHTIIMIDWSVIIIRWRAGGVVVIIVIQVALSYISTSAQSGEYVEYVLDRRRDICFACVSFASNRSWMIEAKQKRRRFR
jgi:hypothetical protein